MFVGLSLKCLNSSEISYTSTANNIRKPRKLKLENDHFRLNPGLKKNRRQHHDPVAWLKN